MLLAVALVVMGIRGWRARGDAAFDAGVVAVLAQRTQALGLALAAAAGAIYLLTPRLGALWPQLPATLWIGFTVVAYACGLWFAILLLSYYGRVLPLPGLSEGNAYNSPALVDGYFITRNSPNPELAWKWMSFLMQHQEASLNLIPPLIPHIDSDEYAERVSPDVLAVARRLPLERKVAQLFLLGFEGLKVVERGGPLSPKRDSGEKQGAEDKS